jgi:hypothetical protein
MRNSHSPVTARTSPTSPLRRVSMSRRPESREPDVKTPGGLWPGRYGPSLSKGFGSSNERGVAEDEAIDDVSPADTPESHTTVDKRSKPALKLEEAAPGSNKKPRCA